MPADLGQADGGHNSYQQPLHQQQVQHPGPQGQTQQSSISHCSALVYVVTVMMVIC